MSIKKSMASLCVALLLLFSDSLSAEEFFLADGQRIIFFGDSITQKGTYIQYFEAYLRTRFPHKHFEIINHGINGETISGTSEVDHDPPRRSAMPRFVRDVAAWKPDVVISCFGMNDGNYMPPEPVRYRMYQVGNRTLLRRTQQEAGAKLVFMTPPPYDSYRRRTSDPQAAHFGYKFAAINYDETLAQYSRWLISLRKEGELVIDLHGPMNQHLAQRRETKVSFSLSPDAVHPNATGHWLMAQQLLAGLAAPPISSIAEIDLTQLSASQGKEGQGRVGDLRLRQGVISFDWTTPLPMPMDPAWDTESIALEKVRELFNVHKLKVVGATAANYQLFADDQMITKVSKEQLSQGVDLTQLENFPTTKKSNEVLTLVRQRRNLIDADWRKRTKAGENGMASLEHPQAKMLDEKLRQLCLPKKVAIRLVPIK